MDIPTQITQKYASPCESKSSRVTERGEIMKLFLKELNKTRGPKQQMTFPRLARIFEGVPTDDLLPFFFECEKADIPFWAKFWYKVKGNLDTNKSRQ